MKLLRWQSNSRNPLYKLVTQNWFSSIMTLSRRIFQDLIFSRYLSSFSNDDRRHTTTSIRIMLAVNIDSQFHAVYLLTSLDPVCTQSSYIGYTTDPERRIRQHNGELTSGAQRTKRRGRPWKMELCVLGFANKHAALRFEWQWQHPVEACSHMKSRFNAIRRFIGFQYAYKARIGVLHELLNSPEWKGSAFTIHFFGTSRMRYEETGQDIGQKIMHLHSRGHQRHRIDPNTSNPVLKHYATLLTLPGSIGLQSGDFDEARRVRFKTFDHDFLDTFIQSTPGSSNQGEVAGNSAHAIGGTSSNLASSVKSHVQSERNSDIACIFCCKSVPRIKLMRCDSCSCVSHILCLADWFEANALRQPIQNYQLYVSPIPNQSAPCPKCCKKLTWGGCVQAYKVAARESAQKAIVKQKDEYKERYAAFRKRQKVK